MELENRLLIHALKQGMVGKTAQWDRAADPQAFLKQAAIHKVEGLAYMGLKGEALPEEVEKPLFAAYHRSIFQDAQLEHLYGSLSKRLCEAAVPHIFLKGAVLKHNYPVPALRTWMFWFTQRIFPSWNRSPGIWAEPPAIATAITAITTFPAV